MQDRAISYVRGDFDIVNNEMRHRRRYKNKMKISAYFYGENITEEEKITAENIVKANAKNFYAVVEKVVFLKKHEDVSEVEL